MNSSQSDPRQLSSNPGELPTAADREGLRAAHDEWWEEYSHERAWRMFHCAKACGMPDGLDAVEVIEWVKRYLADHPALDGQADGPAGGEGG